MPIVQEIPIALTPEEIIAPHGKHPIRPDLRPVAEQMIALAQTLWQPRAVYEWFEVRAVEGERVIVGAPEQPDRGFSLRVGPKVDLLHHARRLLVSVSTIGPLLEEKVHELQAVQEHLKSFLLDSAGVVALGAVGQTIRHIAEQAAADLGWGVSPSLSPGSLLGWPLVGQRELCALLPLDAIGVRLSDHNVLVPFKSASAVIGLGPDYTATKVGSICKYCALQKTCWRRRGDG